MYHQRVIYLNSTIGRLYKDFKEINLKIKPNSTIGFIGKSGSRKTTIFNLISKLYTIKEGEILIDEMNINKYTESTICGNISAITQNPYLYI